MSGGFCFFSELGRRMGSTAFKDWRDTMIRYMDCYTHAALAVAYGDMFDADHKIYDMPSSNPGACTKYGSVDFMQFLYDARIFLFQPILKAHDLAPCDDASRALPVAKWFHERFVVYESEILLWVIKNGYEDVLQYAVKKHWSVKGIEEQLAYFIQCPSEHMLDVLYQQGLCSCLDAGSVIADDGIQVHHIKWIYTNSHLEEFGDFYIHLHTNSKCYHMLNVCADADLHFFKMLLYSMDYTIDCNRIQSKEARLVIDDQYCGCRQKHEGVKRLKLL